MKAHKFVQKNQSSVIVLYADIDPIAIIIVDMPMQVRMIRNDTGTLT